ncbi:hypothetical protein MCETHM1_02889 [Flavobacteriaceae bacterium]
METFIVHPKNNEEKKVLKAFLEASKIKFENQKENSAEDFYDPNFVASMERSINDEKEGKISKISLDDI